MPSTILLSDNGASSGSAGLKQTAGNDGVLILQTTTSGGTATNALSISNTQAITVVNTGTGVTFSSSAGSGLRVYGASGTNQWDMYLNSTNLRFSDNTGGGRIVIDGTASVGTTFGVGGATPSASGAGITFPASQSASSDANTLDDYEEGTFTPAFNLGTWTYSRQLGWYRKVGSQVTVWFMINWTATSNPSTMNVKNFPFTSISTTGYRATGAIGYQTGVTWTASYTTASWLMSENYTSVDLGMQISGGATTFNLGHAGSGEIQGTITYITT